MKFFLNVENGNVTELEWPFEGATEGSGTILDVLRDTIVMSRSSLREPIGLVLAELPPSGQEHTVKWKPVTKWVMPTDLQNSQVEYMSLIAKNSSDLVRKYHSFLYLL